MAFKKEGNALGPGQECFGGEEPGTGDAGTRTPGGSAIGSGRQGPTPSSESGGEIPSQG